MRVVGVIPSRWGSTRLPGKSLKRICGKPLIQHVVERAQQCEALDAILVATDDQRIADAVTGFGGEAVMTRVDHPSGTDRIAEAIANRDADLIVNIQGDEPLLDPALVDTLIVQMQKTDWDMGTAATPILDMETLEASSIVKVVFNRHHEALYFSRSVIPFNREGVENRMYNGKAVYWRHIGLYAYRRAFLLQLVAEPPCMTESWEKLEQLRALHLGCRMLVVETHDAAIGVDTQEDLEKVKQILGKLR